MNFYQAQDEARKQSFWLVCLFVLAVIALVALTNIVVAVFIWLSNPENSLSTARLEGLSFIQLTTSIFASLGWMKALWISALVTGVILIAMLFKWLSLRGGGRVVAESLGGRLVQANTDDHDEIKLLNVVEEMALASGLAVPPVYVLSHESSINAFAAGYSPKDAVIGVSQGCMELLDRDQLQGVIAHEFSHILNGDMRLNLRIISVLHGILMIGEVGQFFIDLGGRGSYRRSYSSRGRDGKAAGFLLLFGAVLWLLGWIGYFIGALIKAGVSRQREYLADASAVQFTRNPDGIGGALQLIGGHSQHSIIHHHASREMSHMFFSQSFKGKLLATHPPLEERIRKVLPRWNGRFLKPNKVLKEPVDPLKKVQEQALASSASISQVSKLSESVTSSGSVDLTGQDLSSSGLNTAVNTGAIDPSYVLIPAALKTLSREPLGALGIALAMLLDQNVSIRKKQVGEMKKGPNTWLNSVNHAFKYTKSLSVEAWLPTVEMLIPGIKSLSKEQYKELKQLMSLLVSSNGKVDLSEWVLFELIRQHGDHHFGLAKPIKAKYKTIKLVEPYYLIVLSRLVYYGSDDADIQKKAFALATNVSGLYSSQILPIEKCSGAAFTRAIHELAKAYPLVKPRLMKGLIKAAQSDAKIIPQERMVVSTIALIWDCPLVGLDQF